MSAVFQPCYRISRAIRPHFQGLHMAKSLPYGTVRAKMPMKSSDGLKE
jgi:hypothetical protein